MKSIILGLAVCSSLAICAEENPYKKLHAINAELEAVSIEFQEKGCASFRYFSSGKKSGFEECSENKDCNDCFWLNEYKQGLKQKKAVATAYVLDKEIIRLKEEYIPNKDEQAIANIASM